MQKNSTTTAAWWGWQCVGACSLLLPTLTLMFADRLGAFFTGFSVHVVTVRDPMPNGLFYLGVVIGLAACALLAAGQLHHVRDLPFASRPVLAVMWGALLALLLGFIVGYLAPGARQPAVALTTQIEVIHQRAAESVGETINGSDALEAYSISGFGITTYSVRTPPQQTGPDPSAFQYRVMTYEEYGVPLRCIRTPIDIGILRPSIRRLFFDSREDQFVWTQLTNFRLLPLPFAVNAAFFASIIWAMWAAPSFLRRRFYGRRPGCCLKCGYILYSAMRCPECGERASEGP